MNLNKKDIIKYLHSIDKNHRFNCYYTDDSAEIIYIAYYNKCYGLINIPFNKYINFIRNKKLNKLFNKKFTT